MYRSVKIYAWIIIVVAIVQPSLAQPANQLRKPVAPQAFHHRDLARAFIAARQSHRPLFVFVTMDGCHYCDRMRVSTLRSPQVTQMVASNFESIVVHRRHQRKTVERLKVVRFPTLILAQPDGKVLVRVEGYIEPDRLAKLLLKRSAEYQASLATPPGR